MIRIGNGNLLIAAMLKHISIAPEQQVKKGRPKVKSRAGNTTKIHLAVDGYGLQVTGGEVNDCSAAPDLIARLPCAKIANVYGIR